VKPTGRSAASVRAERHTLLAPTVVNVFEVLDIAITLWEPRRWREIYERSYAADITGFELEHGVEAERIRYNNRCLAEAQRTRRTVVAEHSGLTDLFVPLCSGGRAHAVLVTGPFATARPASAEVLERWRSLTGRQGHPADPEFALYLLATVDTLVLEGERAADYRKLVEHLALLMTHAGPADEILGSIQALGKGLAQARLPDRMWNLAEALVDDRMGRRWASPARVPRLWALGIERLPERVLVGLFVDRDSSSDPVDELLRRDAFQRACVGLASRGGNVAGRIGGHGLTLLAAGRGSAQRTRRHLLDLAEQAIVLARRHFGLGVHFGLGAPSGSLAEQYQTALSAAEAALSKSARIVEAAKGAPAANPLGALRRQLGERVDENPEVLPARFERYLEAVAARSGHKLDLARAHLEAGFERVADAFLGSAVLDDKSFAALTLGLERAVAAAGTMSELALAYRRAVSDIANAVAAPRDARRDRNLRRAEEYLRRHYAEPLSLARAARAAGFTPNYFSKLFHQKQGVTFEDFVIRLRIERARQLLEGTSLNLTRVAQLSGFASRQYFGRCFKRCTGETPLGHRRRVVRERTDTSDPLQKKEVSPTRD
jgi:AraC-like DNA-binding protein